MSPCCGVPSILVHLQIHSAEGLKQFGTVGVCPGQPKKSYSQPDCYRPTREPKLWKNAPKGYGELWHYLKLLSGAQRWAYDVEITDGVLVPLGMTPDELRAALVKHGRKEEREIDFNERAYDE